MGVEITPFFSTYVPGSAKAETMSQFNFKGYRDIVIVLRNMYVHFHSFGFNILCPRTGSVKR